MLGNGGDEKIMQMSYADIVRHVEQSSKIEGINVKLLPFEMRQETELEKWRAETFWTKEPETIEWIRSFDKDGVFFDVGANIGIYSLFASSLYPDMIIYAFEPMKANFEAIQHNKNLNGFENIIPLPWAMGNREGHVKLNIPDITTGASGSQISDSGADVFMASIDYPVFLPPNYIKIDIDGQELNVMWGMIGALQSEELKSCLTEVTPENKDSIISLFEAAGFTINNHFNRMTPHSRERRQREGITAENIIFTRV